MNLSWHPTPAFRPAHQCVWWPTLFLCSVLGSSNAEGECKKAFRTGGVLLIWMLEWKLRMQKASFFHHSSSSKPKESISHLKPCLNPGASEALQRNQSATQFRINQAQQPIKSISVQCEHWQVTLVLHKNSASQQGHVKTGKRRQVIPIFSKSDKLTLVSSTHARQAKSSLNRVAFLKMRREVSSRMGIIR